MSLKILIIEPKTLYREAWHALFLKVQDVGQLQAVCDWSEVEGPLESWDLIYTRCEVIHGNSRDVVFLDEQLKNTETRVASLGCTAECHFKASYLLYALCEEESFQDVFSKIGYPYTNTPLQEKDLFTLLAPKEYEVVRQLVNGNSYKEIAKQIGVSTSTVQSYKERAMSKLEVSHLSELAVLCAASGIRECPCKTGYYQI